MLGKTLKACRKGFIAVAAFSLCINLLMLTAPLFLMQVFDRVLTSRSIETLMMLLIIVVFAFFTMGVLEIIRGRVFIRISSWLDEQLGGLVLAANSDNFLKYARASSVQGLRDLGTIRALLTGPGIFPILDAPWALVFIGVIFLLHPVLGWISLAGAVVLLALAVANEALIRDFLTRSSGASIEAMNQAEAAVRNADVIEGMGMMPNLVRRWTEATNESRQLRDDACRRGGLVSSASKFLRRVLQVGILSAGAWLVVRNELTPGAMIAGFILMGSALSPVERAIGSWRSVVLARGAYGRIGELLSEMPIGGAPMPLPAPTGKLDVEDVSFIYPEAIDPTVKNVSFSLKAGELVGIIGPTAAGKTTLARMLIGNLVPNSGHVRLDDMDVSEWNSDDLGPHIGYLPQDVELFAGTIQENIARLADGDPDEVVEAARLANIHEMILRLPKGYDTQIGVDGTALSGGQRQRIGLARALYGDPKFIVLDEPNSSLDPEGEQVLLKTIESLKKKGTTTVIVAHRPTILHYADKVLVLKEGEVQIFDDKEKVLKKAPRPRNKEQDKAEGVISLAKKS